jgi:hypothetical protein
MTSATSSVNPETSPLPDVLTDALRYRYTEDEREASRRPPYPIAAALRPHRDRIMGELRSRVQPKSGAPWVVTRMLVSQRKLDSQYLDLAERGFFEFGDAACDLLACAALSIGEARGIVDSVPDFDGDGLRRQIALTLRDRGMLDEARTEANRIGEYSFMVHRDIAWKLADEGDYESFFRHWRDYAAGKERQGIGQLKTTLVSGMAEKHGWRAAVNLAVAEKRLGAGFKDVAISQATSTMPLEQLIEFLAHDARGQLPEESELWLLVRALRREAPWKPTSEHPLLGEVIDRIIAIDPLVDKATMRSRDMLLAQLWPTMANPETLKRVRKAMRTPSLKREFSVLPRDVVPSSVPDVPSSGVDVAAGRQFPEV